MATLFFGKSGSSFPPEPQAQLAQRRIQDPAQHQYWRAVHRSPVTFPDHMQNHASERRVAVVPMGMPAAGAQVDLDITRFRRFVIELNQGTAKIGTTFQIVKPGMKHADGLAVQSPKLVAEHALMEPNSLEQLFRGRVMVFVQDEHDTAAHTEL